VAGTMCARTGWSGQVARASSQQAKEACANRGKADSAAGGLFGNWTGIGADTRLPRPDGYGERY
jgi:hypothetical protein